MYRAGGRLNGCGRSWSLLLLLVLTPLDILAPPAHAGGVPRIAVIGNSASAVAWCTLLDANGYECDNFPSSGPDSSIVTYDVAIDLSITWSDPKGFLVTMLQMGRGVITSGGAPHALGIKTDPTVQAWVGASLWSFGSGGLTTTTTDPILGDRTPGTPLISCNDFPCGALADTFGHPNAKVLATFEAVSSIGILRNEWQGGKSVYFTDFIAPGKGKGSELILNAVAELTTADIPTLSQWNLSILGLLILVAGHLVLRHRNRGAAAQRKTQMPTTVGGFCVCACIGTVCSVSAQPSSDAGLFIRHEHGQNQLALGAHAPFHTTPDQIHHARIVAVPDSPIRIVLWKQSKGNGITRPYYGIAYDGEVVTHVRQTS